MHVLQRFPLAFVATMGLLMGVTMGSALAASPGPGWTIRSVSQPTDFSPVSNVTCEQNGGESCDSYALIVTNVGSRPTLAGAPVTISDTLPPGMHPVGISGIDAMTQTDLGCSTVPLQCVGSSIPAGDTLVVTIQVTSEKPVGLPNEASVAGGGAPAVTTTEHTAFGSEPAPFGIDNFALQAFDNDGSPSMQAGGHPYTLATSLYFTSENTHNSHGTLYHPSEEVKDVIVNLPPGFVGNPQSTPKCPLYDLLESSSFSLCPSVSRIGTIVFEAAPGVFRASEAVSSSTGAIYNMQPEPGFPAEFGFVYLNQAVFMYASPVRVGGQLRLHVTVPGIPELDTIGVTLLFFGDPGEHFKEASTPAPFFTNPVDCAAGSLSASTEVDTWQDPASLHANVYPYVAESTTYPRLTGCNALQFQPGLGVAPETTQADEPSGYTFTVTNPQDESSITPGTPELKDATVTLPAGVSISPSAADGLGACAAMGPEGINIGSAQTGGAGQDLDDPQATELGAGHFGGNGSPYDDGLYHTAPGHCPAASAIGTIEVDTPLLSSPLMGRLYVAQPGCGGIGQSVCGSQDALDGNLFGVYLEAAGSGAIVKLAGNVSVNPSTGQITASFRENPQIPFSVLRLRFDGGPRAALANPQACGAAVTTADFSAWSSPMTLDTQAFSPFTVDWDGAGGACPGILPLVPSLVAETTSPAAAAFSPFSFSLSRGDRQQDFSQLSVTTPPGLLGMLSSVQLCGEPQAAQGSCSAASQIGTATVAAGAGSHPFWVSGPVYLTGSYKGAPFGLSVVVPAKAGPFNLGDVVVRAAISVDPITTQLTVTSDPLPQIIDGIPLRVQTVNVTVNRPGFMFNPDNCEAKQIAVSVTGAQGALVRLSSPFAAAGCRNLPFDPAISLTTSGKTSKASGASLLVKIVDRRGDAVAGKVKVDLPKQLPARLTTLQKACVAAVFEANPAGCPPASIVGFARSSTPVLSSEVSGPAFLVSHGGAKFPELVVVLQGEGIRVDLHGETDIKKGVTSSSFANIPDVPLNFFEMILPEGPHSALATDGNLCKSNLRAPNTFIGENGAVLTRSTPVRVTGCPKPKAKKKLKKKKSKGRKAGSSVVVISGRERSGR